MKDIADDLLDDLQELETSTDELETQVDNVTQNQQVLNKHAGESAMESAVLMLESSKLSQDASIHSQTAAEISLKLAKEQQMQVDDLHQANNSWRQAIRNASEEIRTSKNFFIAVFILSLVTSIGVASLVGWLLFNDVQKQEDLKQNIMDMIQTETTISQRQINLKIDELASVLDAHKAPSDMDYQNSTTLLEGEPVTQLDIKTISPTASATTINTESGLNSPELNLSESITSMSQTLKQMLTEQKKTLNYISEQLTGQNQEKSSNGITARKPTPIDLSSLTQQLSKLEKLLNTQAASLENISKQLTPKVESKAVIKPSQSKNTVIKDSSDQSEIKTQLNQLTKDFLTLKEQQKSVQSALDKLSESIEKSQQEKSAEPKPYSYRSPYEYKN